MQKIFLGITFADLNCTGSLALSRDSLNNKVSEIAKAEAQFFRSAGFKFLHHFIYLFQSFLICQELFRTLYHEEPC